MLAASAEPTTQFTRRDAGRLIAASAVLVAGDVGHPGLDFLPAQPRLEAGKPAPELVQAPRTDEYTSDVLTKQQRDAAQRRDRRPSTTSRREGAAAVAAQQLRELDTQGRARSTPRSPTGSRPRTARRILKHVAARAQRRTTGRRSRA